MVPKTRMSSVVAFGASRERRKGRWPAGHRARRRGRVGTSATRADHVKRHTHLRDRRANRLSRTARAQVLVLLLDEHEALFHR